VTSVRAVHEHIVVELPGATAVFTTRHGGVSRGPYASLNLGRFTDDDPDAVEHNREALQAGLGVRFAYGRQVHGTRVLRAETEPEVTAVPIEADGHATNHRGLAPMVLTADCLPIAIAGGGAVAMLHAGWRGLAGGIVAEGVQAVRELGSGDASAGAGAPLAAAIGPGAGPCCYEVSDDVHGAFARFGPDVRRGRNLDLKAAARIALNEAGVDDVHDVGLCTICSTDFFSHRRDNGVTGRQAGVAWLS
jgi:purine-nucleoside/S-methyl-5'-thioadenosine phosphorylase / adenosine deaminase